MRVLVTGSSGMCGNVISNHLSEMGHSVVGLYRSHVPDGTFIKEYCDLSKAFELDGEFDVIVHCAGALPYRKPGINEYVSSNIDTMHNLLDYAHRKKIGRMIYISTIGIYGDFQEETIDETSPRIDPDDYGLTKYVAERMLKDDKSIKGISLRCPGILGKGAAGVWMATTASKMINNEEIHIYSPDFKTPNFVWIENLARFIDRLIKMDEWKHEELVIACKTQETIKNVTETMVRTLKSDSVITVGEAKRPPFRLDASKAWEMGYDSLTPTEIAEKYCKLLIGN